MILKLDPRYPVVWRSPSSVQIGVDPPIVVVEHLTSGQERLLAALGPGVSDAGVGIVTREAPDRARELLDALAPALLPAADSTDEPLVVALSGSGPLADDLARILAGSGVHVLTSPRVEALVDEGADLPSPSRTTCWRPNSTRCGCGATCPTFRSCSATPR
jgi:hypothetical protein